MSKIPVRGVMMRVRDAERSVRLSIFRWHLINGKSWSIDHLKREAKGCVMYLTAMAPNPEYLAEYLDEKNNPTGEFVEFDWFRPLKSRANAVLSGNDFVTRFDVKHDNLYDILIKANDRVPNIIQHYIDRPDSAFPMLVDLKTPRGTHSVLYDTGRGREVKRDSAERRKNALTKAGYDRTAIIYADERDGNEMRNREILPAPKYGS